MKKKLISLLICLVVLTMSSCETYAQTSVYDDDAIVYEYSYNSYPVYYVNGIPYYYCFVDNLWRWIILPERCYPYIVHHPQPLRYRRIRPNRHYYHGYVIHYNRPAYHPNPRMNHRPQSYRPGGNARSFGHGKRGH